MTHSDAEYTAKIIDYVVWPPQEDADFLVPADAYAIPNFDDNWPRAWERREMTDRTAEHVVVEALKSADKFYNEDLFSDYEGWVAMCVVQDLRRTGWIREQGSDV